jgi:hypothetical protein
MCDANCKITYVAVFSPGRSSDLKAYKKSSLLRWIENLPLFLSNACMGVWSWLRCVSKPPVHNVPSFICFPITLTAPNRPWPSLGSTLQKVHRLQKQILHLQSAFTGILHAGQGGLLGLKEDNITHLIGQGTSGQKLCSGQSGRECPLADKVLS